MHRQHGLFLALAGRWLQRDTSRALTGWALGRRIPSEGMDGPRGLSVGYLHLALIRGSHCRAHAQRVQKCARRTTRADNTVERSHRDTVSVAPPCAGYSGLTPAALITRSQRSRSFASQARNSAGVLPPSLMAPSLLSFSLVSRLASDARIASFSTPTTDVGRWAGPTTPRPCVYCSKPGKPLSDIVGTFG